MDWDISLTKQLRHERSHFELDVTFSSKASRLALFGPSGAGKTQVIKMLAGISRPDHGHVRIAGRVMFDSGSRVNLPARQRSLGYVFQDYALFPHLTVQQNIAFALEGGWRNPTRRGAVPPAAQRWIDAFHLQAVASLYPHQISGGQRQRVALARALVHEPSALLLDEPFAALDMALRRRLRGELKELQASLNIPTLLITHDEEDLQELADDIIHLSAGRVVAPGNAAQQSEPNA